MRATGLVVTMLGLCLGGLAVGCAPTGQGDPCTPEAIPGNGFLANEVYVETSSVQCRTRVCMVYHMRGNPECTSGVDPRCTQPAGPNNPCVSGTMNLCITADDPATVQIDDTSPDRVFCTCRCSAAGNAALPLCHCTDGFRCVPESDPGGGYCVPDRLGLQAHICVNNGECAMLGATFSTCDATHHCR